MRFAPLFMAICAFASTALADPMDRYLSGQEVRAIQARLNIAVDGDYGPQTARAVARFQRRHGLQPDGDAGPETRAALFQPEPERQTTREDRCKWKSIAATGEDRPTRRFAFGSAVEKWQLSVTGEFGIRWAQWDKAQKTEPEDCYRVPGGVLLKRWRCQIEARPCS